MLEDNSKLMITQESHQNLMEWSKLNYKAINKKKKYAPDH